MFVCEKWENERCTESVRERDRETHRERQSWLLPHRNHLEIAAYLIGCVRVCVEGKGRAREVGERTQCEKEQSIMQSICQNVCQSSSSPSGIITLAGEADLRPDQTTTSILTLVFVNPERLMGFVFINDRIKG